MNTQTDVYELNDGSPAAAHASRPVGQSLTRRSQAWGCRAVPWITWTVAALFILAIGVWAYRAGMDLRRDVWRGSRSIRFHLDIYRAFDFGNRVIALAESQAHLPRFSDALAGQTPAVLANLPPPAKARAREAPRRLTWRELERGLAQYYDTVQNDHPTGDFDLDYPPMRLAVATLWTRHAQREQPLLGAYPHTAVDKLDSLTTQPEDVAQPMLDFNSACDGVAAVATFLLVWLWVARGAAGAEAPRSILPHGLLAFLVATAGFWYALLVLIGPPPRPAPAVMLRGAYLAPDRATVVALINPEFSPTRWHVDWGPTDAYGHTTFERLLSMADQDTRVTAELRPIKPAETIHFRVTAVSPAGTTRSDDAVLHNQGSLLKLDSPVYGGMAWPNWTVWLRMLALFIIMVASARRLPLPHRGWACGLIAALLVWFDPMNLTDSHIWPQWDVWILPAFLIAALLGSLDWWLTAGLVLGIGCMFKGQLLLAGPMLLLWPFFAGRMGPAVRILTGFLIGAGIIVWPWIIADDALHWLELVMFAAIVVLAGSLVRPAALRQMLRHWRAASNAPREPMIGAGVFVAVYLPAALSFLLLFGHLPPHPDLPNVALVLLWLAIVIPPWILRLRWAAYWLAAVFAAAIWIAPLIFHGDFSWWAVGFAYGAQKHDVIAMGQGSYANLGALLNRRFDWQYHQIVGTLRVALPHFNWSAALDLKTCLSILYGACLLISGIAAAIHSRRRDPRFLLTLIVPWIAFPLVLGQMGSRYMLWACAISSVAVAVSTGLTLLHVLLTLLSAGMVAKQLLLFDPSRWPRVFTLFTNTFPDIGWMLLLIAGIYLVCALIPTRRAELVT